MKRTLQELLDYAEGCMDVAQYMAHPEVFTRPALLVGEPISITHWQRQAEIAAQLAHATALASAIHYRKQEVDLSE